MTDFCGKIMLNKARMALISIFLAILVSSCSYREVPRTDQESLLMARGAYMSGNYNLAIRLYGQLADKYDEYRVLYAHSLRQSKQLEKAISVYNEILARDSRNAEALHGKAVAFFQNAAYEDSLNVLLEALNFHHDDFDILNTTAIVYAYRGDKVKAIKFFKAAINAAGYDPIAFKRVVQSLASLGNLKTSILLAKKVSKNNKVIVYQKDLDTTLATLYAMSGNVRKAVKVTKEYISEAERIRLKILFRKFANHNFAKNYLKNELKILPEDLRKLNIDLTKFIKRLQVNKPPKRIIYHDSNDAYNDG